MPMNLVRRVPTAFCPLCHLDKGEAVRVTAEDADDIAVVYRCPKCHHAWTRTYL